MLEFCYLIWSFNIGLATIGVLGLIEAKIIDHRLNELEGGEGHCST